MSTRHRFLLYTLWSIVLSSTFLCAQENKNESFASVKIDVNRNGGSLATNNLLSFSNDNFLWYTTTNGVVKDFGKSHTLFELSNEAGIGIEQFSKIYEARNGDIWLGTNSGLYHLNVQTGEGEWIKWRFPESEEVATILDISELSNGHIALVTSGQYNLKYDPEAKTMLSYRIPNIYFDNDNPSSVGPFSIIDILETLPDNRLIFSQFNSIYVYENGVIKLLKKYNDDSKVIGNEDGFEVVENGLYFPKDSSSTYVYEGKTYRYDYFPSIDRQIIQLPSPKFKGLYDSELSTNGIPFIAQSSENPNALDFYNFDVSTSTLVRTNTYYCSDLITDYVYNKELGTIAISSLEEIEVIKPFKKIFKTYLSQDVDRVTQTVSVRGFAQNDQGKTFVGTYAGLFELSNDGIATPIDLTSNKDSQGGLPLYRSMQFENDSIMWAVGDSHFISRVNIKTKKYSNYPIARDVSRGLISFFDIQKWTENEFILGSTHGLWSFDRDTRRFKNLSKLNERNNLSSQNIRKLIVEDDGGLWMATTGAGVFYKNFTTGVVDQYTFENTKGGLGSNVVYTMYKAQNGSYYIGTNEGISFVDKELKTFNTYTQQDGIANNTVIGIQENSNGIWFSTFNGLSCYHYDDDWFYNFFEKDGLPHNEFNQQSFFKDRDGELFFGGLNGLVSFKSEEIPFKKPSATLNPVSIEYYDSESDSRILQSINLQAVLPTIDILPDQNFFIINYALSNHFNAEGSAYEYKIDDLSTDWISLGTNRELRLYGLPAGRHSITIRATDVSGNPSLNTIEIPLNVQEIIYKRNWFIAFSIFLLVAGIIGFYQFRRYRWKEKFRQQRELDQLESKALRAQMNPHFMFNALNGLQSTMILKGEREANKYLGSFSKLLRASLDMSKSDIITLEEEISYLDAYLNLEKQRQARDLETEILLEPEDIDTSKIKIPCMLFQPLLENAILHGLSPKRDGEAKLSIKFIERENSITGIVQDNGIGREAANVLKSKNRKTHKSWATTIMEERIEIINKYTNHRVHFEIEDLYTDGEPSGTKVTLKLPLSIS